MQSGKLEWKLVQVDSHELEATLNELSGKEYEVFTVQFTGKQWSIVARKASEPQAKKTMGFGANCR